MALFMFILICDPIPPQKYLQHQY